MEKNLLNKEEQTLFEQAGIAYEMKGDFAYPILGKSDLATVASIGKHGRKWMSLLFEIDRQAYNKYLLSGELTSKAMEFNEQAFELADSIVRNYVNKYRYVDRNSSTEIFQANMQGLLLAEEIITNDAMVAIEYAKQTRFDEAMATNERQ